MNAAMSPRPRVDKLRVVQLVLSFLVLPAFGLLVSWGNGMEARSAENAVGLRLLQRDSLQRQAAVDGTQRNIEKLLDLSTQILQRLASVETQLRLQQAMRIPR
jgi:hypothetical protein